MAPNARRHFISLVAVCTLLLKSAKTQSPESGRDLIFQGGIVDASTDPYPFQVALHVRVNGNLYYGCGGTLIHPQWVLTAAHCALHTDAVSYGSYSRSPTSSNSYVNVLSYHRVPGFTNMDKDVAILRLEKPITTEPIIKLNRDPKVATQVGETLRVSGWGRVEGDVYDSQGILREANVRILSEAECDLPNYFASHICALGSKKETACGGDSGSPLMRTTPSGEFIQVGIVSRGQDGCLGTPVIYSRVSTYISFIESTMKKYGATLAKDISSGLPTTPPEPVAPAPPAPGNVLPGVSNVWCGTDSIGELTNADVGSCFRGCLAKESCLFFHFQESTSACSFFSTCVKSAKRGFKTFSVPDVVSNEMLSNRMCKGKLRSRTVQKIRKSNEISCARVCAENKNTCRAFFLNTRSKVCYLFPKTCTVRAKKRFSLWLADDLFQ